MIRRSVLVILVVTVLASCVASVEEMPAIPQPDLAEMEPLVTNVLTEARQLVVDDPASAEGWGRLAAAYHAHALNEEAAICYHGARILAPRDFRWAYLLAVLRTSAGAQPKESMSLFNDAAKLRRDYAPLSVRVGQILLHHGKHKLARKSFARAAKLDPSLAAAQRGMGQAFLAEGNAQLALMALERAAELMPDDASTYAALARALTELERADEAQAVAVAARHLRPVTSFPDPVLEQTVYAMGASARHWFARAQERISRGEFAEALLDVQAALSVRPGDPDTLYLRGLAHRGLGETGKAEEALTRAVIGSPGHVPSHVELGRLLLTLDRTEAGLSHLRHAQTLAPDDPTVLAALGPALAGTGDVDGAIEVYETMIVLLPDDPRVRLNLGTLLARRGDLTRAENELRQAVELDPAYSEAHLRLAVVLDHGGRTEEAARHREAAEGN